MRKDIAIQYIATDKLKLNAKNPRKNDAAVDTVAKSIEKYGFKNPVIANSSLVVYCGNTRLKAARKLGLPSVPVIVADDLTEKEIRELAIIDNKSSEIAEWDMDMLADELSDLDLDEFNLDFDIDEGKGEITEDEPPEVDEEHEPICKLGDIWQLGEHRLMCGNSTDKETIERLMDGKKADLLLTDPPYGINVVKHNKVGGGGATHFGGKKANNFINSSNYQEILNDDTTETAKRSYELAKQFTNNQIIFGGNYFTDFLPPKACWCIWDKENTGNFADVEMAWTSFDKGAKLYKWLWNGLSRKGDRATELKSRVHPTQKPVGMLSLILKDFTADNKTVLDLFGGSGSTLIACEQLNRTCYMCELDPKYCDVIIKRWENLTGKKAVRYGTSS